MTFRRVVVVVAVVLALMVAPGIFEKGYFVGNSVALLVCAAAVFTVGFVPFKGEVKPEMKKPSGRQVRRRDDDLARKLLARYGGSR
jgi:hypothetical protein